MELTPKQKRFCEEYVIDHNATQAANRAGYKDGSIGRQLITKNNVSTRIVELQKEISDRLEITTQFLTNELLDNHREAKKAGRFSDSNKAIELLGKLHNKFIDRIHTKNDITFEALLQELNEGD